MAALEREERRRYRKIHTRIWGDQGFRSLSKPQPNAQSLFFYLLTGPHTTNVPGLSSAGERMLAERLGWPLQAFRRSVGELTAAKMVFVDWTAPLIWLPNAIAYNEPESPNVVKSWGATYDEFPECHLKAHAGGRLRAYLRETFTPGFEAALPRGWPQPKPQALPQATDNQEQEQEPEQEQSTAPHAAAQRAEADKALGTGAFIRRFCELYKLHRGATYHYVAAKHTSLVRSLLRTHGREQLEKLSIVLLTATADSWVNETDRGIEILHTKINWLADRLAAYERQHGPIQLAS